MAVRLLALRAGRPLPPRGRFLVFISVTGWVDPKAIVRVEGLGQLKKSNTSLGIESATFRLVAYSLNYVRYRVPPHRRISSMNKYGTDSYSTKTNKIVFCGLFCEPFSISGYKASNSWIIGEQWTEKDLRNQPLPIRGTIAEFCLEVFGRKKNLDQYSRYPFRASNYGPPEYEVRVILV
jgi:hypothetical protein